MGKEFAAVGGGVLLGLGMWLKSKNPLSEAVRREREEDWNRPRK
jgi:hypothetical protein